MTFRDDAVSYNADPFFDFVPFTKRRGAYQYNRRVCSERVAQRTFSGYVSVRGMGPCRGWFPRGKSTHRLASGQVVGGVGV